MMGERSYDWEEIKDFLVKELRTTKHILTYGTIGSLNVSHDIDTIITKKPSSPSAAFYQEVHLLFEALNNYLGKKYGARAIRFSNSRGEFLSLFGYKRKDLAIHTMIYTSYPQIERDWNWSLFKGENVKDILKEYNCLLGNVGDLFSKDFQKPTFADPMFIFLNYYDRINSYASEKKLVTFMRDYYDFLYRKKLSLPTPIVRNKQDVKKAFYDLCSELDKLNK